MKRNRLRNSVLLLEETRNVEIYIKTPIGGYPQSYHHRISLSLLRLLSPIIVTCSLRLRTKSVDSKASLSYQMEITLRAIPLPSMRMKFIQSM